MKNNKRLLLGAGFATAGGVFMISDRAIDAFFWMIFAGVIPGTNYTVHPTIMLIIYLLAATFIIYAAFRKELYPSSPSLLKAQREANRQAIIELNRKAALERRREIRRKARLESATERKRQYRKITPA